MSKYYTQPGSAVIGGVSPSSNTEYVKVLAQNRGLLTIDPILAATFVGKEFFYSEAFLLDATTDTRDLIFQTPNTTEWAHFTFRGTGSAITEISLWEDTVLTSTDALTTYNNNRNSTDSADCLLYQCAAGLSATDTGTRLFHMKSGSATNQSRSTMTGSHADEVFLKSNSKYRIAFRTETTGNLCNLLLQWHEHTNEGT